MKLNWPLLALSLGAFGIGTTEFAPMGLLPVIAHGLGVSLPKAGLLVTGYALGVVAGAPLLTLPTGRLDRRTLLVGLMLLFTLGNALSAVAPGYATLLAARVLTSLCHGAYFGVGSVVAARFAGDGKAARCCRRRLCRADGRQYRRRPARGVDRRSHRLARRLRRHRRDRRRCASVGAGARPAAASRAEAPPDVATEIGVFGRREVLLALATTAFGSAAMFTVFTYIAPILQGVTHVGPGTVALALVDLWDRADHRQRARRPVRRS